ncbi:MAG: phosphatase PAP2 family protein, partial [Ferruginibacter sp.]
AFFCSMAVVAFLVKAIFLDKAFTLDEQVFMFFNGYVSDATTSFFKFFTFFGSHNFLVPANLLLMGFAFFVLRNKWFGIKIAAVAFSSLLMMFGLKMFFNRPRPEIPLLGKVPGLSFPSGHAFMSFTFFGLLIYVIHKQVKTLWLRYVLIFLCLCMIVIIGLSRIYLRVHYFSDVIAGISIGLIWLVISLGFLNYIEKRSRAGRVKEVGGANKLQ